MQNSSRHTLFIEPEQSRMGIPVVDIPSTNPLPRIAQIGEAMPDVDKVRMKMRMEQLDEKIIACEREYANALQTLKSIWENITDNPSAVAQQVKELIDAIASSAMMESEIAIHFIVDQNRGSDRNIHAMHVAMLSMIMAKEMGLPIEQIKVVGIGALFHDVGWIQLPRQLKEKSGPLTSIEAEVLHQHCKNGVDICNKLELPYEAVLIVWQHHECLDGSGRKEQIHDRKISPLAGIVAVANVFDETCNPVGREKPLTPHEALSVIYAQQRRRFDARALGSLVHCLGAYPPGTLVSLTNGVIGMVMSVNIGRPLKPVVLAYDSIEEDGRRERESILIDLDKEVGIHIAKTYNPHQLPREIVEFLSANKRTSYYVKSVH